MTNTATLTIIAANVNAATLALHDGYIDIDTIILTE